MENFQKSKKRAVTYGKAARKQSYGRPVDLDSEDELSSMGRQIGGKLSKSISHRGTKATSASILASKLTTPPMSPSPSITSPSSSTGTKRTSPFIDEPSEGQKRKLQRTASSSSFEDMFPVVESKAKKSVPKLGSKKPHEALWSTSDDTQLLLDNQLRESTPPPAREMPNVVKKASALKMPTRVRPISIIAQPVVAEETESVIRVIKPSSRAVKKSTSAEHPQMAGKALQKPAVMKERPKTPEKAVPNPLPTSIISPSNIELDALQISINRNHKAKTPEASLAMPPTQSSPMPTPFRVKLKDRMTSDLTDMVVDIDSSANDISTYSLPHENKTASAIASASGAPEETRSSQQSSNQGNTQSGQPQGPKVTYGAARWTFLPDEDEDMTLLGPILDSQESNGQSQASRQLPNLSKTSSTTAVFDMASDDDESTTAMRSLHELKKAGGSQRITRQIEGLLDDVEQCSMKSQRINALTELVLKLKQSSFLRQFLDSGAESRLLTLMDLMKDAVARILYCSAFLLILHSPNTSMISIGTEPLKLSQLCSRLLDQTTEVGAIIKTRNSNVSKDNQKSIEKLFSSIRMLPIWSPHKPSLLTPQTIGLACLERLVRSLREGGNQDELLSTATVNSLAGNLSQWEPGCDDDSMLIVWLSLSTLESVSLSFSLSQATTEPTAWNNMTITKLVTFFTRFLASVSPASQEEILSLVLRICLNLSNRSSSTCLFFCNVNFVQSTLRISKDLFNQVSSTEVANKDLMLDNLVLSLGLLINLSEKTSESRELFLVGETREQTPLQILLQLFKSRLQDAFEVTSEAEIRSNVPFGYLAVLLGYLCKSAAIFSQVRSQLDGGNLRLLLIAIGEFLQYHQKVEELRSAEAESEVKVSFISRLQGLMDELRTKDASLPPEH